MVRDKGRAAVGQNVTKTPVACEKYNGHVQSLSTCLLLHLNNNRGADYQRMFTSQLPVLPSFVHLHPTHLGIQRTKAIVTSVGRFRFQYRRKRNMVHLLQASRKLLWGRGCSVSGVARLAIIGSYCWR